MLASALLIFLLSRIWRSNKPDWTIIQNSEYSQLLPYLKLQAKVESANYTSKLFREYNNAFGMGCVRQRKTTQVGCTDPVFDGGQSKGIYRNVNESIKDQLLWLRARKFPLSVGSLSDFAYMMRKKGFYTTSQENYEKALRSWQ